MNLSPGMNTSSPVACTKSSSASPPDESRTSQDKATVSASPRVRSTGQLNVVFSSYVLTGTHNPENPNSPYALSLFSTRIHGKGND